MRRTRLARATRGALPPPLWTPAAFSPRAAAAGSCAHLRRSQAVGHRPYIRPTPREGRKRPGVRGLAAEAPDRPSVWCVRRRGHDRGRNAEGPGRKVPAAAATEQARPAGHRIPNSYEHKSLHGLRRHSADRLERDDQDARPLTGRRGGFTSIAARCPREGRRARRRRPLCAAGSLPASVKVNRSLHWQANCQWHPPADRTGASRTQPQSPCGLLLSHAVTCPPLVPSFCEATTWAI
jgi:hypothetical protein